MPSIPSRRAALPAAVALCAFVSGCATEATLKRLDPALTEIDLRQGKVAVLGVVKFQEPDQVRPPLVAMLERTFREERRDIPLLRADSAQERLGIERTRRLLLAYEYQGALDPSALEEITDSLRGAARYLLLARVEKDRTRYSARGTAQPETTSAGLDFTYTMGITGRDARVAVHLYDLSRKTLVVSATYEGSSENSKPMLSPVRSGGGSGVTLDVGEAVPPEERGYPGPPDLALAIEEPFRTFARALPGAPIARRPGDAR